MIYFLVFLALLVAGWLRLNSLTEQVRNLEKDVRLLELNQQPVSKIKPQTPPHQATTRTSDAGQYPTTDYSSYNSAQFAGKQHESDQTAEPERFSSPGYQTDEHLSVNAENKIVQSPDLEPVGSTSWTDTLKSSGFEWQFGAKTFVWLGGIALALAALFLVKYSLDTGLLSPALRVTLGGCFGIALLVGSYRLWERHTMADHKRIAQAVAGAGLIALYGTIFAATNLYGFFHPLLGFAGMVVVTLVALAFSLAYGAPIATLGLLGGFVTPILVGGEPNIPLLLGYILALFTTIAYLSQRQSWSFLVGCALAVTLLWALAIIFSTSVFDASPWLCVFLAGILGVMLAMTARVKAQNTDETVHTGWSIASLSTLVGCVALMAILLQRVEFGGFEWAVFTLFAMASLILARLNFAIYAIAPWLGLVASLGLILLWSEPDGRFIGLILGVQAVMWCGMAYTSFRAATERPLYWLCLLIVASIGLYLAAYYHWYDTDLELIRTNMAWSFAALLMGAFYVHETVRLAKSEKLTVDDQRLMASVTAATAAGLIAFGFAVLWWDQAPYLVFILSLQLLAITWIQNRHSWPVFGYIAAAILALIAVLQLWPLLGFVAGGLQEMLGRSRPTQYELSLQDLLFRFMIPAISMWGGARLLTDDTVKNLRQMLIAMVVLLSSFVSVKLTTMMLGVIQPAFDLALNERTVTTLCYWALALTAWYFWRTQGNRIFRTASAMLASLAAMRTIGFDLFLYNPLFTSREPVGEWPVLNGLIWLYLLPTIALFLLRRAWKRADEYTTLWLPTKISLFALVFVWVSLTVRQLYHGPILVGRASDFEIYTYSAVWLVMGIVALLLGTWLKDKSLRAASLAFMLLTIGKVFLFDAAALDGLMRVVSLLGLGISLLGLSWFYSRFVFVAVSDSARDHSKSS